MYTNDLLIPGMNTGGQETSHFNTPHMSGIHFNTIITNNFINDVKLEKMLSPFFIIFCTHADNFPDPTRDKSDNLFNSAVTELSTGKSTC